MLAKQTISSQYVLFPHFLIKNTDTKNGKIGTYQNPIKTSKSTLEPAEK